MGREGISTPKWVNHTKVCRGEGSSREDSSDNCREVHIVFLEVWRLSATVVSWGDEQVMIWEQPNYIPVKSSNHPIIPPPPAHVP